MYCPAEECNPDKQECIVLYNGIDQYYSTVIQGDKDAPKVGYGNGACYIDDCLWHCSQQLVVSSKQRPARTRSHRLVTSHQWAAVV